MLSVPSKGDTHHADRQTKAGAHDIHPKSLQTPCVHGAPILYGHASPLLLQTCCEALLSSSALLLPGRLHPGCRFLLTRPCRHSLAAVTAVTSPWVGACHPSCPFLPTTACTGA